MTATPLPAAERWKEQLKEAHPDWSIVFSNRGRWWAFLAAYRRGKDAVPVGTVCAEADTPEELHALLVKAES